MGLPTGLRKRGDVYYVQFKQDGEWRLKSVGRELEVALEQHRELRGESRPSVGEVLLFDTLVERWLRSQETRCKPRSVQISRQRANGLLAFFGGWPASRINGDAVEAYIRWRREQGVLDITVNASLTTLRQILRYAHLTAGLMTELPVRVRLLRVVRKHRRHTFDRNEIQKLLATAQQMNELDVEAFIRIAASTGLRMDEILHLRWEDIDDCDGRIDVRTKTWIERRYDRSAGRYLERSCSWSAKSHQDRSVWIENTELFAFLRSYRVRLNRHADGDWVFQGREPGLRLTTIVKPLRAVFQWAGLYEKGKLAHTFRHSVATSLLESGVDLETVRDWLGHQQITTTALYLHASDKRKKLAAKHLQLV